MKRFVWVAGFSAALGLQGLQAGNFLRRKGEVVSPSRIGEHPPTQGQDPAEQTLVAPAQQPGASLVEQVDPSFGGNRGPGPRPVAELRYRPSGIRPNEYVIEEVDPNGPYAKKFKEGQTVTGEALGLKQKH